VGGLFGGVLGGVALGTSIYAACLYNRTADCRNECEVRCSP
jgi:hypothetical protein